MTVKEAVLEVIQQLPGDVTYEDVLEQVATLAAIERGQQAAAEGRTMPPSEFEKQLIREELRLAREDVAAGRLLSPEEIETWSAENVIEALAIRVELRLAEAEIEEGHFITQEQMEQESGKWISP